MIIIDNKLTFEEQVEHSKAKARKRMYALRLAAEFLDINGLKIMANGLVFSALQYCNLVIAQASETNLSKLQKYQDKTLLDILHLQTATEAELNNLRIKLGWLTLKDKRTVHLGTLIWRCLHEQAPASLCVLFKPDTRTRTLRNNIDGMLCVPKYKTDRSMKMLRYRGPMCWNKLPTEAKEAQSAASCRQAIYLDLYNQRDAQNKINKF